MRNYEIASKKNPDYYREQYIFILYTLHCLKLDSKHRTSPSRPTTNHTNNGTCPIDTSTHAIANNNIHITATTNTTNTTNTKSLGDKHNPPNPVSTSSTTTTKQHYCFCCYCIKANKHENVENNSNYSKLSINTTTTRNNNNSNKNHVFNSGLSNA